LPISRRLQIGDIKSAEAPVSRPIGRLVTRHAHGGGFGSWIRFGGGSPFLRFLRRTQPSYTTRVRLVAPEAIARREVALSPQGTLRLGVVADTHSAPHPGSHAHVAALSPDAIVHAGDIGDLAVLDEYAAIAPLHAIRGNIDTRAKDLPDVLTLDVTQAGHRVLRLLVVHIGVYGPRLRAEVAQLARREQAAVVVCGHSHVPFVGAERGITVFNPGSVGPRRFSLPIVFGRIDIAGGKLRFGHVDAASGAAWTPD
jgi:putative phosphoesterase